VPFLPAAFEAASSPRGMHQARIADRRQDERQIQLLTQHRHAESQDGVTTAKRGLKITS